MAYKTREEAIKAAKICLESGCFEDFEVINKKSKHKDEPDCWCAPERIDTVNGIIYIHRKVN